MDSERNDTDKFVDDVILPGFRFHPTDEELVGFYLRRKVQERSLPIELIKQVDIYKYDPWDLPKIASTGEKEWYFYCPRDRKYRNSARPNRVTGAGFWKATGTDRPICSSEGSKCIGLKKSLVFYIGRAAKGVKTDWMMHEFRLPSLVEHSPPKKLLDKSYPANDAWAICRIFKKTNSTAQRALSQSWLSPTINLPLPLPLPLNNGFHSQKPCPYPIPPPTEVPLSESMSFDGSLSGLVTQQDKNMGYEDWGSVRTMGFPFTMPSDLPWDSQHCPTDMSTGYSTNKCYS